MVAALESHANNMRVPQLGRVAVLEIQLIASLVAVPVLEDRHIGLRQQGEATGARGTIERYLAHIAMERLDPGDHEHSRAEQADHHQPANGRPGGIAYAAPRHP